MLNGFFAKYKNKSVTTQNFIDHVEQLTSTDLRPLFTKNVFGNFMVPENRLSADEPLQEVLEIDSKHPAPLTPQELNEIR